MSERAYCRVDPEAIRALIDGTVEMLSDSDVAPFHVACVVGVVLARDDAGASAPVPFCGTNADIAPDSFPCWLMAAASLRDMAANLERAHAEKVAEAARANARVVIIGGGSEGAP